MQGISRAHLRLIPLILPTTHLRWALCLKRPRRWRPRITVASRVFMHRPPLAQDGNERRLWTSNRVEFQPLYKELPVILIRTLPSGCSPALHITRHRLMATSIPRQMLVEGVAGTSEITISSATSRPGQWATASCTRINGIDDDRYRPLNTFSIDYKTPGFLSACNHGRYAKLGRLIANSMPFRQLNFALSRQSSAQLDDRLTAFGMSALCAHVQEALTRLSEINCHQFHWLKC